MNMPVEPSAPIAVPSDRRGGPPAGGDETFTREQVFSWLEQVRKEEKDKLYPQISGLKQGLDDAAARLTTFEQERQERLNAEAAAQKVLDDARSQAEREKLSLSQRFEASEAEWSSKFAAMDEELKRRDVILSKEREYAELTQYRAERVAALREPNPAEGHFGIMPEFEDLIRGGSREDIDASVATMVAKTRSIVEGVQQHEQGARAAMPGVSPTAGNIGPIEQAGSTRRYGAEEIAAMGPEEYAQFRPLVGMDRTTANRGWFG